MRVPHLHYVRRYVVIGIAKIFHYVFQVYFFFVDCQSQDWILLNPAADSVSSVLYFAVDDDAKIAHKL